MLSAKRRKKISVDKIQLYIMCLPALTVLFLLKYLPLPGLILAFKDFRVNKGIWKSEWIGLKNFKFLFESQDAWRITRNSVGLNIIFIVMTVIISVIFALMLNEISKKILVKTYQTVMFVPYFISWVVATYALYAFLGQEYGMVNVLLESIGKEPISWYTQPQYWPLILTLSVLWKGVGYTSVVYYAGLMGISKEYYEAAAIDGATKFQMAYMISLPLIKNLIIITVLLQVGRIFYSDFGMFYNLPMQSGMLYSTTDVIDTYVFRSLRVTGNVGMASAAGLYQSMVGFILVMITNHITRKFSSESSLF